MAKQDFTKMSVADLTKNILDLRKEQFDLRMKKSSSEDLKTHRIREVRRSIARLKTILHQKQTEGV